MNILHIHEVYEPTDTERQQADAIEYGEYDETGGTVGNVDWYEQGPVEEG